MHRLSITSNEMKALSMLNKIPGGGRLGMAVAGGVAKERVASALSGASGQQILWDDYCWPHRHEYLAIIHFDLAELREKRPYGVYLMVRGIYWWWAYTLCLCLLNLISVSVLAGSGGSGYSGVNVLFSVGWLLAYGIMGMIMTYKCYHGICAPSRASSIVAKVLCVALQVMTWLQAFANMGSCNGWSNLGGRIKHAQANGLPDSAAQYWTATVMVESLLWTGALGWLVWCTLRIFRGPSDAAVPLAAQAGGATAPAADGGAAASGRGFGFKSLFQGSSSATAAAGQT